jgi:hypothetical protein
LRFAEIKIFRTRGNARKTWRLRELCQGVKEMQPLGGVGFGEHFQKQSAEQTREHAHRQEESGPAP